MNQEDDEKYPASAVSSWSGFVYQGKIALYHSLKLIHDGDLDFELQLDSSDDFAIYKNGKLHCSGQLKLATALEFFQYRFSDSFGGNPPL